MSKPTLVPLPFVLLLLDYWPLHRWRPFAGSPPGARGGSVPAVAGPLLEKIPLLLLSAATSVVVYRIQVREIPLHNLATLFPLPARLGNAVVSIGAYLGDLFLPVGLAVFYPHPGRALPGWKAAVAALLVLTVTAIAFRERHRRPWLAVGWLWYLALLVPVAGIVQVGLQGRADRYTYLPLVGVAIALSWGLADMVRAVRLPRRYAGGIAAATFLVLGVLTWHQCGYWRSMETLFRRSLAVTGPNAYALTALGIGLNVEKRFGEAIAVLRQSLAILPDYGFAHYVYGNSLTGLGRREEAITRYRVAVRLTPKFAEAHNNLGATLAEVGNVREAEEHLRTALVLRPGYRAAADNLGRILARRGDAADR